MNRTEAIAKIKSVLGIDVTNKITRLTALKNEDNEPIGYKVRFSRGIRMSRYGCEIFAIGVEIVDNIITPISE